MPPRSTPTAVDRPQERRAEGERSTDETKIRMALNLDGEGSSLFDMEIAFFEHMLSHLVKHSLFDLQVWLRGDLSIDAHHSVEDSGILLGRLLKESLGDKRGIYRYGHFTLPMDDTLTTVAIDLSGRSNFTYKGLPKIYEGHFGNYAAELTVEFLEKLAMHAAMNLHVQLHYGENRHHIHESIFKALGRSLRMAVSYDAALGDRIASTKGDLN